MTRYGRTVVWDDDDIEDSSWMPLIVFLARAKDCGVYPPLLHELDVRDFMLMHGVERKPRPFVYAYKHIDSRRYVHVDKDGTPYRFLPTGESGQYRTTDFVRAVYQLDPWFIRKARQSRRGLDLPDEPDDEGWVDDDWVPPDEEFPTSPRLRLVR